MPAAQVLALQRSAGNHAVARLLRTPNSAEEDELLALVLRDAAFRAREAQVAIEADKTKRSTQRFRDVDRELSAQLDEAVQLAASSRGGRGVEHGATSLFAAAMPLLKLAGARGFPAARLQKKLTALGDGLKQHGYRVPQAQIDAGRIEAPHEPSRRDAIRTIQLSLTEARAQLQAGAGKLAAERKAGHEPAQLHGGQEGATHLRAAAVELREISGMEQKDYGAIVGLLQDTGRLGVSLLRENIKLGGAKALWDAINDARLSVGLDPIEPFGTPTATSRAEAASERLTAIDAKRRSGQANGTPWTPEDTRAQAGAEHEAIDAGNEALDRARHAPGDHVNVADVVQRVTADINRIELARSLGYTDAVTYLASTALDTPSNVSSFVQSLIGNLTWALSSFLPVAGVFTRVGRFAAELAKAQRADAALGAAFGVFGAMLAQFSSLPSSGAGDVSGRLDVIKQGLKDANSQFCDTRRAQAYILMTRLLADAPPKPDDDRAAYLASLETALRYALFGDVFERNLNNGAAPQESKVEAEARRQLLVAAAMPVAGVTEKGKLEAATPGVDLDYAKKILKGVEASGAQFDRDDLVGSRIAIAAREIGGSPGVDLSDVSVITGINAQLTQGQSVEIPISGWNWTRANIARRTGGHGTFTRWSELVRDKRAWTEPAMSLDFALDHESLKEVVAITVSPKDLVKRTFHGKEILVLDRVKFSAVGGEQFGGSFRGSKPPPAFKLVYSFAEA